MPLTRLLASLLCLVFAQRAFAEDWMLQVEHRQRPIVGRPLQWDNQSFLMLARDGQIMELDLGLARQGKTLRQPFHSYSAGEMRAQLMREFGSAFEVKGTGHYLVVHPAGQPEWPARFEALYREFTHYFGARGISVSRPPFPLVAVVFPTHESFLRYAAAQGGPSSGSVLGYYSAQTNRILLYDVTAGGRAGGDWRENAETIVHEAAHQTAFNVGIHSRYALPPRWLAEGLGTLFEAPGVYNSASHPQLADRLNREQLTNFRRYFRQGVPDGMLAALVASDDFFKRQVHESYALSWAFTFMVAEQSPSKLAEYLQLTAGKPAFTSASATERMRDFQSVFGSNLKMIQVRIERFMAEL